jgi:transposase
LSFEGKSNDEIAEVLGTSRQTVSLWRNRFAKYQIRGLKDASGRGRKRTYGSDKVEGIINATLKSKPKSMTHWSTRTMAEEMGVSHMTVHRIWKIHRLKPHLVRTFKLSNDKYFTEKLHDIVGLYLNPPDHALVYCVDEKSQIQALDRTQPGLPIKKGRCGTMTHDYKRHGTTTLFAALNVLEGVITGKCSKRHRHQEYLRFIKQLEWNTPKGLDLHLIVDNYTTHKHEKVKEWLASHPRVHVHFTPTSSSWLNLVERFFAQITQKRIRRGVFRSVIELTAAIDDYIEEYNTNPKPFKWVKTADEILKKIAPLHNIVKTC